MAALTTSNILSSVFDDGATPIGDLVKGFNFSSLDLKNPNPKADHLHVKLAPAYGGPEQHARAYSAVLATLEDNVRIMVAGTMKSLSKVDEKTRGYDTVLATLTTNPLLDTVRESAVIRRSNQIIKDGSNVIGFGKKSPDAALIAKVQAWFADLVGDKEIVTSIHIAGDVLKKIVEVAFTSNEETDLTLLGVDDIMERLPLKKERSEKSILDITLLRFPTKESPTFQLANIKIHAWSQSEKILLVEKETTGLTAEYTSREFKPYSITIDGLKDEIRQSAIKQANELFH